MSYFGSYKYKNSFLTWQYTQDEGQKLGVRGWCMNTYHGTVAGQLEGPQDKVMMMYVSVVLYVWRITLFDIFLVRVECTHFCMHCAD